MPTILQGLEPGGARAFDAPTAGAHPAAGAPGSPHRRPVSWRSRAGAPAQTPGITGRGHRPDERFRV